MASLKIKFKVETLFKIIKFTNLDEFNQIYKSGNPNNKTKPSSAKQSARNSKTLSADFDSLPSFEQETKNLPIEEKDELINYMRGIDYNSLMTIFNILQNNQFYEKIKSKLGLEIIRSIFKEILKNKSDNIDSNLISLQETLIINEECELYYYFRNIFNISELDAIELFEILKTNEFCGLTEQNFVILIYLLASYETGNLEDFILIFSEDVFESISGRKNYKFIKT